MIQKMKIVDIAAQEDAARDAASRPFLDCSAASRGRIGLLLCAAGFAQNVAANGWVIRPYLAERAVYNSNQQLTLNDPVDSVASVTELAANFERKTARWDLRVTPKARFSLYSTDRIDDGDEYFLELAPTWRGERYQLAGQFFANRESTLSSELTDSGILIANTDRDSLGASLQIDYRIKPRHQLSLTLYATDVTYRDKASTGYVDYQYYSFAPQYSYAFSERSNVFLSTYVSRFDAGTVSRSDSVGAQLGYGYRINQRWNAQVALGLNYSDTTYSDVMTLGDLGVPAPFDVLPALNTDGSPRFIDRQRNSSGVIVRASLDRQFERGSLTLTAERRVQPSSLGAQTTDLTGELIGRYRVDQRLNWYGAIYLSDRATSVPVANNSIDRIYGNARVAMQYRLSRLLVLEGRYELRAQEYDRFNRGAAGHVLGVHLSYAPDPYQPFEWFN